MNIGTKAGSLKPRIVIILHDDVIKWKHFLRYWPFVRGSHRSLLNSPHRGQWCGALMFSLVCDWTNDWANNRDAGDLRRHGAHYYVTVMNCVISGTFGYHNENLLCHQRRLSIYDKDKLPSFLALCHPWISLTKRPVMRDVSLLTAWTSSRTNIWIADDLRRRDVHARPLLCKIAVLSSTLLQ